MISQKALADKIKSIGFGCFRCGACCRCVSHESNLVMVSPDEVRAVISASGLAWDTIAEPYPEVIVGNLSARYTLGWCLRRENDRCQFLMEKQCTIYPNRPWICRTYPFVLDGDDLAVSACEGLGQAISDQEACNLAYNLLQRRRAEEEEERQVQKVLQHASIPTGKLVVIDTDGVRVIDG